MKNLFWYMKNLFWFMKNLFWLFVWLLIILVWVSKPKTDEEKFIELLKYSTASLNRMNDRFDSMNMILDRMTIKLDKDIDSLKNLKNDKY